MIQTEARAATAQADDAVVAEIAKLLTNREPCVLILGAGVHAPPPKGSNFTYPPEARPPLGGELAQMLSQDCGCDPKQPDHEKTDLQRAAMCYEICHGRNGLVDLIESVLTPAKPSPLLLALAELPFQFIITTNFDRLFERALQKADKEPFVSVYSPDQRPTSSTRKFSVDQPFLLKVHGSIEQRGSLVVTDEDYIQFILRMRDTKPFNPIPEVIEYQLGASLNLFMGYSLKDYNLRLLLKTVRWNKYDADLPKTYSVDFRPDRLIRDVWETRSRYVSFIVEDHWSFVPRLYRAYTGKELEP